ncbi:hypothetical protein MKW94_019744 [Papaver nudicaule]|uniref:MADS-box domain-containing protein n=1 Tax=Papaver nudicaule TaxID=74823 RepID=A0AA42B0T9_PAPNU|nr:hypothetical protein [Papaver nudicaule]
MEKPNLEKQPNKGRKRNCGRKRIDIKPIDNKANRQVTFSKRRNGLFTKASELCVLCGAELAIIVFSPARKAFVFGHPDPRYIINRFLTGHEDSAVTQYYNERLVPYKKSYMEVVKQVDVEKKKGTVMEKLRNRTVGGGGTGGYWWDAPMDSLSLNELELMKSAMEDVQINLIKRFNEMMSDEASSLTSLLVPDAGDIQNAITTNDAFVSSFEQATSVTGLNADTVETTPVNNDRRVDEMMSNEASSSSSSMLVPYTGENATPSANGAFINFSDGFSDAFLGTCQPAAHSSPPKTYDISKLF